MRALTKATMAILAGFAVSASSCGNKVETVPLFPPAVDLVVKAEPTVPDDALTDPAVEDQWRDDVLIWGREGWKTVARICRWAAGHGSEVVCPEP